jgi:hypothetical protein
MVRISKQDWLLYIQRLIEVSKHRDKSGRYGGVTQPVTPSHQGLYFQALNAIGCHNELWFRKFKISMTVCKIMIRLLRVCIDLTCPLPDVSTTLSPVQKDAAVTPFGRIQSTPSMEQFDSRQELRNIMYEYIEFVQHSKDKVKVDAATIAALTPSKSLPDLTIAIKRKNGRFLKVNLHGKFIMYVETVNIRETKTK